MSPLQRMYFEAHFATASALRFVCEALGSHLFRQKLSGIHSASPRNKLFRGQVSYLIHYVFPVWGTAFELAPW